MIKSIYKYVPKYNFFFGMGGSENKSGGGNTLYDRCGGKDVIEKSMKDFKTLLRQNPELEHYFIWKDQRKYIPGSQAYCVHSLGGPYPYKGRNLRVSHRALKISNHYFDIAMDCLETAFKQNGVDDQTVQDVVKHFEEFREDVTNKYKVQKQDVDFFEKYYNEAWINQVKKDEEENAKKKEQGNAHDD